VVDVRVDVPVVAADPHSGPCVLPTIDSDNLSGAGLAVGHLLGLGHRRIAMLSGRADLQSAQLRELGYRRALEAVGLPVVEEFVVSGAFDHDVSVAAARGLLGGVGRPSAIFAGNDLSAIAAIEVAGELGLRVPEDLSVVGFDNIPESALCSPPLTTVDQPIRVMGQRAVELLIRLVRGEPAESTHITLPTNLVIRQSTAPL
jgi:LacI family transcriptional regulator